MKEEDGEETTDSVEEQVIFTDELLIFCLMVRLQDNLSALITTSTRAHVDVLQALYPSLLLTMSSLEAPPPLMSNIFACFTIIPSSFEICSSTSAHRFQTFALPPCLSLPASPSVSPVLLTELQCRQHMESTLQTRDLVCDGSRHPSRSSCPLSLPSPRR